MFIKLTDRWADKMCAYLGQPEKKSTYSLGISALLFYLVTFGLMIVLSILLDALPATLLILLVFCVFRQFGGGAHLQEMIHCTIVTNILIVGSSYLVTQGYLHNITIPLYIATFVFNLVALAKWVPVGTEKKPLNDPIIRKKMWKQTFLSFIVWNILIVVCFYLQYQFYVLTLIVGNLLAVFLLCPAGYKFLQTLHIVFTKLKIKTVNVKGGN